jgi:hypothetical protein
MHDDDSEQNCMDFNIMLSRFREMAGDLKGRKPLKRPRLQALHFVLCVVFTVEEEVCEVNRGRRTTMINGVKWTGEST